MKAAAGCRALATAAIATAVLSGCGGDDEETPGAATTEPTANATSTTDDTTAPSPEPSVPVPPAPPVDPCSVLAAEEIDREVGLRVAAGQRDDNRIADGCRFSAVEGRASVEVYAARYPPGSDVAAIFSAAKDNDIEILRVAESVDDLGDDAYVNVEEGSIDVRVGGRTVKIRVDDDGGGADRETLIALARRAVPRLAPG